MQCEQRFAASGMSLKHSEHFFVVGSEGGFLRVFAINKFIGLTTKKNTAPATSKKEIRALIKCPYINLLPFSVNVSPPKSGTFAIAEINGVNKSATSAFTIVPNAAPTTTPTAKSTTFPRSRNCLNSLSILQLYQISCSYEVSHMEVVIGNNSGFLGIYLKHGS